MTEEKSGQAPLLGRIINAFDRLSLAMKQSVAMLAAAGPVALIAFWAYNTEPKPGAVECEGEQMSPGDICEEYRNGELVDTKTYDEVWEGVRNGNLWVGRIGFAIAVILIIAGTYRLVVALRERRATAG